MQSSVFRQVVTVVVVIIIISSSRSSIISLDLRQALRMYFNNVRLQLNFYAIFDTVNSMGWSGLDSSGSRQ
jgi:hypothetical protein